MTEEVGSDYSNVVCLLPVKVHLSDQVIQSAERLAGLLIDAAAFQDYLRLDRELRVDAEASRLMHEIDRYSGLSYSFSAAAVSLDELHSRLEALPVVSDCHAAENALRGLFSKVDQVISAAAGASFSENARASGCG